MKYCEDYSLHAYVVHNERMKSPLGEGAWIYRAERAVMRSSTRVSFPRRRESSNHCNNLWGVVAQLIPALQTWIIIRITSSI
jgi:hypothetical protein